MRNIYAKKTQMLRNSLGWFLTHLQSIGKLPHYTYCTFQNYVLSLLYEEINVYPCR